MQPNITVVSNDVDAARRRDALAWRVVAHFGPSLPESTLLCLFDGTDWHALRNERGEANRGFYAWAKPFTEDECWDWPQHLRLRIFADDPESGCKKSAFDNLIYLHDSTSRTDTGLVMTFAHELQHFVQHNREPKLWAESSVVTNLTKEDIRALNLNSFHIPIEREARAVSKLVAEELCGAEAVRRYINGKIEENVNPDDVEDWKFVRGLNASVPYDLKCETRLLFQRLKRFRPQLDEALRLRIHGSGDPAFDLVDLNELLAGAA
jgi:hypothetical protein